MSDVNRFIMSYYTFASPGMLGNLFQQFLKIDKILKITFFDLNSLPHRKLQQTEQN
jgi:hypothetical protein